MAHGSSGLKRLVRELAKFGAVGGAGVLVNLGVFNLIRAYLIHGDWVLTSAVAVPPIASAVMVSPEIATSASKTSVVVATRPPRMIRS